IYHGLSAAVALYVNGTAISSYTSQASIPAGKDGTVWDAAKNLVNVYVASRPVDGTLRISTSSSVTATGGTTGDGGTTGSGGTAGGTGGGSGSSSGGAGGNGGGDGSVATGGS
ncbi:MAG TPA: hypothetical protein VF550_13950, partial [Polyangia bacterium]